MQIVAVGKDNAMRKEDIATDVRIQTVIKESPTKKEKSLADFEINEKREDVF